MAVAEDSSAEGCSGDRRGAGSSRRRWVPAKRVGLESKLRSRLPLVAAISIRGAGFLLAAGSARRCACSSVAAANVERGRSARGRQARGTAVPEGRLHGPGACRWPTLAARILPGGGLPARPARPGESLRRGRESARNGCPSRRDPVHRSASRDSLGTASAIAFTVGLIGALWAATGAMGTIVKAVNRAYECEETRNLVKVRVIVGSSSWSSRRSRRPRRSS